MKPLTRAILAALLMLAATPEAGAQTTLAPPQAVVPARQSNFWFVAGIGFGATRAGCPECDREGVSTNGRALMADAGMRVNPSLDIGIELAWGSSKFEDTTEEPILTTFIMGVAQVRPWKGKGFFFKAGIGAGIVGNGLIGPIGPELKPPYTTNTLAVAYGAGWVFRREHRFTVQVHGTHHVAALGELTTISDTSIKNVVANHWTTTVAFVIR